MLVFGEHRDRQAKTLQEARLPRATDADRAAGAPCRFRALRVPTAASDKATTAKPRLHERKFLLTLDNKPRPTTIPILKCKRAWTARHAADAGYRAVVVSDGTSTVDDEWQNVALNYAMQNVASVGTCAEIAAALKA